MGNGTSKDGSFKKSLSKLGLTKKSQDAAAVKASYDSSMTNRAFTDGDFTGAPLPPNETERLEHLCALNVLDTPPDRRFDDITKLCCMVFKVPIALVSLVDKDRQWFKSVQGLDTNFTDRKSSFCAWTLLPQHAEVLVVPDALEDLRFCKNALVTGPPDIRFYAGAPLVASNGLRLGSLCIIDRTQREFDAQSCLMLVNMAEMVVREIEKDWMLAHQQQKAAMLAPEHHGLLRAFDGHREGVLVVNTSLPRWPVLLVNDAWAKITGMAREDCAACFWDSCQAASDEPPTKLCDRYMEAIVQRQAFYLHVLYGPHRKALTLTFRCATKDNIHAQMPHIIVPSLLAECPTAPDSATFYFAVLSPPAASMDTSRADSGSITGSTTGRPLSAQHSESSMRSSNSAYKLLVAEKLDPFEDVKLGPLLGRGAFGRVYRGWWNGVQVAVKVMEHTRQQSDNFGGDILEALLSGQVAHPNVVNSYRHFTRVIPNSAVGDDDDSEQLETWMIMEYCNKGTISDAVDKGVFRKKHSLFESDYRAMLLTAREIAGAMCFLHGRNILHSDLTGNNILLASSDKDERQFTAKVADFGLSRILAGGDGTVVTQTYGTVTHMPPELLLDGVLGKPADVFAYGVIMWEVFMGQRPYAGMSHGQIIHCITSHKLMPLSSSCPMPLKKFLQQCYAPNPADRPTFPQIIKMLDELEEDLLS